MRILSFGNLKSGCWWIRIKKPLEELGKRHYVMFTDGSVPVPLDGWDIVVFNNLLGDIDKIDGVAQESTLAELIGDLRKGGTKIVYDTDDAQDVHPDFEEQKLQAELVKKHISSYEYLLKESDLITVTTRQLADHVGQFTDKPIKVIPNCINPAEFTPRKKEDRIKIGFAGSLPHKNDMELVMPAIKKLKEKYGIYFEILGFQIDNCKWKKPVPIEQYYRALSDLGADIGICPLKENLFNINKSPLKFLEYSMVGSMVLASRRYPYVGELKDEWMVDDDQWYETLERYILDTPLREATAAEQRQWVLDNRDITKQAILWEEAYQSIC